MSKPPFTSDAEEAMFDFLESLGMDMEDTNLLETPKRVAKMFREELLSGYSMVPPNLTSFETPDVGNQSVTEIGIPVHSLCAHHLMPIAGFAAVSAYFLENDEGNTYLLGLSKFARVVDMFSRRLQTQEAITSQICKHILENTTAVWVGVQIKADHFCMSHRGVKIHGAKTITKKFMGKPVNDETIKSVGVTNKNYEGYFISEARSEELKRTFLDELR